MSDISNITPEIESGIRTAIRSLYPEEQFPVYIYPTLEDILQKSLLNRLNKNDKVLLFRKAKTERHLLVEKYCSIKILIDQDPNTLVLMYLPMVTRYVKRRCVYKNTDRVKDITQEFVLILLKGKLKKIWEKYQQSKKLSEFSAFFVVSMRYIVENIIRDMSPKYTLPGQNRLKQMPKKSELNFSQELIIQTEISRFNMVLSMYYKKRSKIELLLKLKYGLPIFRHDVIKWSENTTEEEIKILRTVSRTKSINDVYAAVSPIMNRIEKKKNKANSLVRWIHKRKVELITLMNKMHSSPVYDSNTFETLVSLYYYKYNLNNREKKNETYI